MHQKSTPTARMARFSLLFALLFSFGFALQAQLIANSSFELWTGTCPVNTAPDSWTNYSAFLGPDQGGTCAGTTTAHTGDSYMNLVWINSGLEEGAVQTITGLTIGTTYRISFWGINSNGLYANPGDVVLQIHMNSTSVFSTPNITPSEPWTEYTYDFVATGPTETVGVRVVAGANNTSGSAGVDDFTVTELVSVRDDMMHPVTFFSHPNQSVLRVDQGDYYLQDLQNVPIELCNMMGQRVLSSTLNFSGGKAEQDLSTLQSGIYLVKLTIGTDEVFGKIYRY